MSFAHPWMLAGMAAALIPVLVHLFDRRRPRPLPFAALAFVLRSQKRTASRLKLKRLLLYALRTLLLLALPLALARPELRRPGVAGALTRGPAATAIIVDASLAMRYHEGGQTLFARARDEARSTVRGLLPEEPATLLLCGPAASTPPAPGFERARLLSQLDEAQPSYQAADMTRCLELAAHALEESPMATKRLIVISAFVAGSFHLEVPLPTVPSTDGKGRVRPDVVLRDVARGRDLANHALVEVRAELAPAQGPRAFGVAYTVKNFGAQPLKDLGASLLVSERVVQKGFVDVAPQGTAQKTLTHRFDEGGWVQGSLRLIPDGLEEDDRRDFVLQVPRELRALVIDGAPSPSRFKDEAFFVDAALSAPGSPVQEVSRDAEAGLRERFEDYDVVELLNVPAPSEEQAQRLKAFVEHGGGLFISAGDQVEPDAYNARLGALLPRPMRVVRTAVQPGDPEAEQRATRFKELKTDHPLFLPFTGKAREGLTSARFYRYLLLEAGKADVPGTDILATYQDGAPALATMRVGRGRVLLFTSTVDRDWSDLAIRTSFLPLAQRSAAFLAGSLEERETPRARVGESLTLHPDAGQRLSRVRGPAEVEARLQPQADGTVVVGPLAAPGLYAVLDAAGKPVPALAFSATLDPGASDLTRLKPDELSAFFGQESTRSLGSASERPVPLWTWLLVAAVLAFFFEGVLLRN